MNSNYFTTALHTLCQQPHLISDAFLTKEKNNAGIYAIRFFINGTPRIVVIDDFLPFSEESGEVGFMRSKSGDEIWMCLVEKAWAKLHGGYCMVGGGEVGVVLSALTNQPTEHFTHRHKPDQLWAKMKVASRLKGLLACESARGTFNLVQAVYEVATCGKIEKLVKVRNSMGKLKSKKPMR